MVLSEPKVLIFGVTGQDGFYLKEICEAAGGGVYGVSRSDNRWIIGDVSDRAFVDELIRKQEWSHIVHLAANSTTSHAAMFENHAAISTGTLNILEACYRHSSSTRVFLAGSGLQFQNEGLPINERTGFAATSPYSIARNAAVFAARYYRSLGLRVYVGYLFHHDSPIRSERHLNMKIVKTVGRIRDGSAEKITVGNAAVVKEFNYARDLMEGVWTLINQERVHEAVIGSGIGHTVMEWIELCFGLIGRDAKPHVNLIRDYEPEFRSLISDPATMLSLGWRPRTGIHDLAAMMMMGA